MRNLLGGGIFVIGVVGLCWWGAKQSAPDMQNTVTERAAQVAATSIHGAQASVSGRDITLTGIADSPAERDSLLGAFDAIDGRRVIRDDLTVLDTVSPYELSYSRGPNGAVSAVRGVVPTEAVRDVFAGQMGDDAQQLTLASGAPDANWSSVVVQGLGALDPLNSGSVDVVDQSLMLKGVAATPVERDAAIALLGDAPEGYSFETEIETVDDGLPFSLIVDYTRGEAATASGKFPSEMEIAALSELEADVDVEAMNFSAVSAGTDAWPAFSGTMISALGGLETGQLSVTEDTAMLRGAGTRAAVAAAEEAAADVPDGFSAETDLTFYDDGVPFSLNAQTAENGPTLSGKLPYGTDAAALGLSGDLGDAVTIADIDAPDGEFIAAASAGLAALAQTEDAALTVADPAAISLTGTATTPQVIAQIAADLDAAPGSADVALTPLDDGTPLRLSATLDANGLSSTGKLPMGSTLDLGPDVTQAAIPLEPAGFEGVAESGLRALGRLTEGALEMEGTDLRITGKGTRAQIAESFVVLDALPEGYTLNKDVLPLDDGLPLGLTAEKAGDTVTMIGKMPFGTEPAALGLEAFDSAVIVSEIDPNAPDFVGVTQAGLGALAHLDSGSLAVTDALEADGSAQLRLEGIVARDALEDVNASLGALPEGIAPEIDVVFADDTTDVDFTLAYGASEGAALSGLLPARLNGEDVAAQLGLEAVESNADVNATGDAAPYEPALAALGGWLPELEQLEAVFGSEGAVSVKATPAAGVDAELLNAGLAADLPDAALEITAPADVPPAGAERRNAASGAAERSTGLAWLPVYDFDPSVASCGEQTSAVLDRTKINFVTGSARLSARSVRAINALSGVMAHCLAANPNLVVEVGGHTDSDGSEAGNLALSQARAEAVVAALTARGVTPDALTPTGFGEALPIADNGTEEGRAANRRTTFEWSEGA